MWPTQVCGRCSRPTDATIEFCCHCGCYLRYGGLGWDGALLLQLLVLFVFLLLIFNGGHRSGSGAALEGHGSRFHAYVATQRHVKRLLESPSTAEFPGPYFLYSTHLGDGRYRIDAYADSQNPYAGTMVRTHFVAVVEYKGGETYALESLEFEDGTGAALTRGLTLSADAKAPPADQ